jgi:hypothetical protein
MPAALWILSQQARSGQTDTLVEEPLLRRVKVEKIGDEFVFGKYIIDYSDLEVIKKRVISADDASSLRDRSKFKGRQVLIGDLGDRLDHTCVPGRPWPVSGVLIHACSLATLNKGLFLGVTPSQGWTYKLIVLFAAWCILLGLEIGEALRRSRGRALSGSGAPTLGDWNHEAIEILFFSTIAFLTYVAATWMVASKRYFWPDFLWIVLTLFLHPFMTEPFFRLTFQTVPKAFWTAVVMFARTPKEDHPKEARKQ